MPTKTSWEPAPTWPIRQRRYRTSSQHSPQLVHLRRLLRTRDQELYGPIHLVHTAGTPLYAEERLVVPVEVEAGDYVREEVFVVGCRGGGEELG